MNLKKNNNIWILYGGILLALVLGGRLVLFPITLNLTLAGLALWGLAVYGVMRFLPDGKGDPWFSGNLLRKEEIGQRSNRKVTLALVLLALLLFLAANQSLHVRHWIFWVALLALAAGAVYFVERNESRSLKQAGDPTRWKAWHIALLLAVGAFFLLYRLNQWPNWMTQDEGAYMWVGVHHYSSGQNSTPFFADAGDDTGLPELFFFYFFKLFGVSHFSAILFPALLTLACLPFVYGFALYFVPAELALATALLFAVSRWILFFVRGAHVVDQVPAAEIMCLYFFVSALETGRKRYFTWFGLALAFCFHTYLGGRVFTALFAAFFVFLVFYSFERIRKNWKQWMLAWGVFALFMMPIALWYWKTPTPATYKHAPLVSRFLELSIFSRLCFTSLDGWRVLWEEFYKALNMFSVQGMKNPMFNLPGVPMLDPLAGFCFWVGLAWCLFRVFQFPFLLSALGIRIRHHRPVQKGVFQFPFLFICLGFFGTLSLGVFTVDEAANPMRMILNVPFCFLMAAIGADRLARLAGLLVPAARGKLLPLFLAALVLSAGIWNFDVYFRKMPQSREMMRDCGHKEFLAAQTLGKYPAGWDLYDATRGAWYQKLVYTYQKGKQHVYMPVPPDFPLKEAPEKGAVLFMNRRLDIFEGWIRYFYPGAKRYTVSNAFGEEIYLAWELTPSEVKEGVKRADRFPAEGVKITAWPRRETKAYPQVWPAVYGLQDWIQQWAEVGKCVVEGRLNLTGREFFVRACGRAELYLDGVKAGELPDGLDTLNLKMPPLESPARFKIEYAPITDHFFLEMLYDPGDGKLIPVPPSALRVGEP